VEYWDSEETTGSMGFFTRTQLFMKKRDGPWQGNVGGEPAFRLNVDFSLGSWYSLVGRNGCLYEGLLWKFASLGGRKGGR